MSNYFPESVLAQVRQAADIVALTSEYITLKKSGSNFQSLCPFHLEKTPSFNVSPERQIFKCFGCGKAGNVFHFLMAISNITFPEAVRELAKRHGISLPEEEGDAGKEKQQERDRLFELLKWSTAFFQKQLATDAGAGAHQYLVNRKFAWDIVEKFQLGFAPQEHDKLFKAALQAGFTADLMEKGGLIAKSHRQEGQYYDLFRNRLMFPICNVEGHVVAFGGRTLSADGKPKYLNSPETALFSKKRILYGLHHAKQHIAPNPYFVVMEGYTDVLMAYQYKFDQAVATLGTSLTEEHARLMHRYVDRAILLYDGDPAGQTAMLRVAINFLSQGLMVRVAILPDEMDPYDFLVARGGDPFEQILQKAQDFLDFQIEKMAEKCDLKTTTGRRLAVAELAKTVKQIPDQITQRLFITRISEYFKIPMELVSGEILQPRKIAPISNPAFDHYRQHLRIEEEQFLLWVSLHYPDKIRQIFESYSPQTFQNSDLGELANHISDTCQKGSSVEISALSSQLDPCLGEKLVNIYYKNFGDNLADEELEKRLQLIFKSVMRNRYAAKFAKLKEIMATSASGDQDLRLQILEDARNICKAKMQKNLVDKSPKA